MENDIPRCFTTLGHHPLNVSFVYSHFCANEMKEERNESEREKIEEEMKGKNEEGMKVKRNQCFFHIFDGRFYSKKDSIFDPFNLCIKPSDLSFFPVSVFDQSKVLLFSFPSRSDS